MNAYKDLDKKYETLVWSEMPKLVGVILSYGRDIYDEDDLEKAAAQLAALEKVAEIAKESLRQLEQLHRYYSEYAPCNATTCNFIKHQKALAAALAELEATK